MYIFSVPLDGQALLMEQSFLRESLKCLILDLYLQNNIATDGLKPSVVIIKCIGKISLAKHPKGWF